ncbi:bifunctional 2-polyprenyl-6-hydroxyphenol methylase/3-demethylubiquinol 3-O-methyltransferase UbiG [Yoonia sp.]|uniref:bifunctional 2-polyprenyl-6-hydroxyphenol methylase/3-demethylubiquinol 3-O-methyltransferase UbiG n=1 Tax=Yoonia sp. TaxID=2212373 RepID=UPI003976EB85
MTRAQRNNLAIYDDVADQWWADDIRWVRTLKNMVPGRFSWFDQMTDWQGKTVLDLGCAGGFMTEALDDRAAIATGIDPAKDAIASAKAHAQLGKRKIHYDVGVGEALPYEDASFDAIVCVDVFEHVQDLGKVVSEIVRVLRPGGALFYDTINRNPLARFVTVTIAEDVLRILPQGTHDPSMFIKPSELKGKFESAGLIPGKTAGLGPRGINRRGDFIFGRVPGTFIIFMGTARKPLSAPE